jgi:hypothetical protein
MGVGIRSWLKVAAMVLVITSFLLVAAGIPSAEASANLTAWLSTPPNSFEPMGFNVNGTSAKYVVDTLGWAATKIMGNVGIGDGSMGALNGSSNQAVNHTDDFIMAGDLSMAPLDPMRLTSVREAIAASNVSDNTTPANETNNSSSAVERTINTRFSKAAPENASNVSESTENLASIGANESAVQGSFGSFNGKLATMSLNDPYHSILMGRPVDDLCYQAPFAISISMYARLVGLPMPSGGCANIGIRNLGYGY